MTVKKIYLKYLVPNNLQKHMLRVAALAQIISEKWSGDKIKQIEIVKACLFHDIAKPITFDPDKQTFFGMTSEEIDNLKKIQQRLKANYGSEEHRVSIAICKENGLSQTAISIVNNSQWKNIPELIKNKNFNSLIEIYCDMRIAPGGILLLFDRLTDLERREPSKNHNLYQQNAEALEKQINQNVKLNLNSISNEQLNSRFKYLMSLEI